jgi:hypothetical protein
MTDQQNDAADTVGLIGQTVYPGPVFPWREPHWRNDPSEGMPVRVIRLLAPMGQTDRPGRRGADPLPHG